MTEAEKFTQLVKEFNKLSSLNLLRETILLIGLYAEYLTNELLKEKFKVELDKYIFSEDTKLRILRDEQVIEESEYKVLDYLRIVRNRYVHKLVVNEDTIREILIKIPINWNVPENIIQKSESNISKFPFARFFFACFLKLGYLFDKLSILRGEEHIKEVVSFDISKEGVCSIRWAQNNEEGFFQ